MLKVNFGGGRNFIHQDWINLDAACSQKPIFFDENTSICFQQNTIDIAYSSHTLEHLNDRTVSNLLRQIANCLKESGVFVIKIPDFDKILKEFKNQNHSFFENKKWNFDEILKTWSSRGIKEDIVYKVSMIFCGFWTEDLRNHFLGPVSYSAQSYHGPAPISILETEKILHQKSPHSISRILTDHVKKVEPQACFNHQNSWSRQELRSLIENHGMRILTFDLNYIISSYAPEIPDLKVGMDYSMYAIAIRYDQRKSKTN